MKWESYTVFYDSFLLTIYIQVMQAIQVEIFYISRSTSLYKKSKFSTLLDSMERGLDNTSLTRQGLVWPSIERIICCLLSDGECVYVFCKWFTVLWYFYQHIGLWPVLYFSLHSLVKPKIIHGISGTFLHLLEMYSNVQWSKELLTPLNPLIKMKALKIIHLAWKLGAHYVIFMKLKMFLCY